MKLREDIIGGPSLTGMTPPVKPDEPDLDEPGPGEAEGPSIGLMIEAHDYWAVAAEGEQVFVERVVLWVVDDNDPLGLPQALLAGGGTDKLWPASLVTGFLGLTYAKDEDEAKAVGVKMIDHVHGHPDRRSN